MPHFLVSCQECARLLCIGEDYVSKTNRKAEHKRQKDAYTGRPLTQKQFADLVNAYEVENRQETQVSAYKGGLGEFFKKNGLVVLVLLFSPPLALLSGCAYNYNSNRTIKGDSGSVNAGVSTSSSRSTNISIGGKTQIKY